jgi:hypothetical protein
MVIYFRHDNYRVDSWGGDTREDGVKPEEDISATLP